MNLNQSFTKNSFKAYQKWLISQKLPQSTINRKLASLRRFQHFYQTSYLKNKIEAVYRTGSKPVRFPALKTIYHRYTISPISTYLNLAILTLFSVALGIFGYNQIFKQAPVSTAYPTTPTPPNRQLSFQAR